ncbi:MAG: hypothetical protein WC523_00650 [Patescibacteria group bacterium]
MTDTNNGIPPELLKSLNTATMLMQNVLNDIKEHTTSLAIMKTKMEDLADNVDLLSHVVRDGNGKGSMMTRVALAERALEDAEEQINDLKDDMSSSILELKKIISTALLKKERDDIQDGKFKREQSVAKWKFWGAMLAALAAMSMQLFQLIK